jgi:predicted RNA-binding protein with PUA-like domain
MSAARGHWLFKTEPSVYGWDDLARERGTTWDGVKNPLALSHLRATRRGDQVLVYHTGSVKAAVGIARIAGAPAPDPRDPRLVVVALEPETPLARPVTLAEMRREPALAGFDLLRLPRLSVVPVSPAQWQAIVGLARTPAR